MSKQRRYCAEFKLDAVIRMEHCETITGRFLRAFENAVIRLVGGHSEGVLRLDELADFHQAVVQGAQFVRVPLELFPQDAHRLLKNWLGDSNFDLVIDGAMNQLECLTPEV
jgi:hypothetical protein